jgi:hypothetical protein
MESFAQDELYKVGCNSVVDHLICFECESKWRSTMPVRDGTRVMTCPTCRQPEIERSPESMKRELSSFYSVITVRQVPRLEMNTPTIRTRASRQLWRCFLLLLILIPVTFFGAFAYFLEDRPK